MVPQIFMEVSHNIYVADLFLPLTISRGTYHIACNEIHIQSQYRELGSMPNVRNMA